MTDDDACWHILTHNCSQALWITLAQVSFFVALSMCDLTFYFNDIKLSPENLIMIIVIGAIVLACASFLNLALWKHHHRKGTMDEKGDPIDIAPLILSKAIVSVYCRSDRKTFQDFNQYADPKETLSTLRRLDIVLQLGFVASICAWLYICYHASTLDGPRYSFEGYNNLTEKLNLVSFLCISCLPGCLLVKYSISTRSNMLKKASLESGLSREANDEIKGHLHCKPLCSTSYLAILSIFSLFVGRLAFFMVFENIGIFTSDFQTWEHYTWAASMILFVHFLLVFHTIRMRSEWYDVIPTTNQQNDEQEPYTRRKDRKAVLPLGHDIFFSTTQLLSAHLFGRAVFSAIFIGSAHGPQHRGVPIFFDLFTCLLFICSFRYLLYSDYLILDFMNYSDTLTEWRKLQSESDSASRPGTKATFITDKPRMHGSDRPANEVGEGVETVAMQSVFITERPIY